MRKALQTPSKRRFKFLLVALGMCLVVAPLWWVAVQRAGKSTLASSPQPPQTPASRPSHPLVYYYPRPVAPPPMGACPACNGAGYFLKFPRDLCPKCGGYGSYTLQKYYEQNTIAGTPWGVITYRSYIYAGEEEVPCEVCNGMGVIFNQEERCGTCGGVITEEWKTKWRLLAKQAALFYPPKVYTAVVPMKR